MIKRVMKLLHQTKGKKKRFDDEDDEEIKQAARLTLARTESEEENINSYIERDLFDTRRNGNVPIVHPPSFDV